MTIIDQLLGEGTIERVPPDPTAATSRLEQSERHLEAAALILDVDPAGAYGLVYEAARKAVAAVLIHRGFRPRAVPGSHRAVARFATALAETPDDAIHLDRLDSMRRNRNQGAYGMRVFGRAEIEADLGHGRAIVEIARRHLS